MIKIILAIYIALIIFIIGNICGQYISYEKGRKDGAYRVLQDYMVQLCCSQEIDKKSKTAIRKYYEIFWNKIDNNKIFKSRR